MAQGARAKLWHTNDLVRWRNMKALKVIHRSYTEGYIGGFHYAFFVYRKILYFKIVDLITTAFNVKEHVKVDRIYKNIRPKIRDSILSQVKSDAFFKMADLFREIILGL